MTVKKPGGWSRLSLREWPTSATVFVCRIVLCERISCLHDPGLPDSDDGSGGAVFDRKAG